MSTAPAAASVKFEPALPLPAALAAALDATGGVRVRHPATGAEFRLVPDRAAAPTDDSDDDRPPTPAERAAIDGGQSDLEAIREGLGQANAGELMSRAKFRAAMEARHPRLRGR